MNCLIVSDQIRVQMNNEDMAVPAEQVMSPAAMVAARSALQRPDMSRMRLAAMLRRGQRNGAATDARLSWSTMLGSRIANCANSNG